MQFLLFLPQKSELTYSKQFRCQPQSSIISTTDWQWRSPNVHKLSALFFSRRDRVLYFISQYFISWPSHEVSSSSSSDSAGGTGNWLLCSTAQEFRRALILNSLHFWPEARLDVSTIEIFLSWKDWLGSRWAATHMMDKACSIAEHWKRDMISKIGIVVVIKIEIAILLTAYALRDN